ncbi:hypothetical protein ACFY2W_35085 [Streptomyces sp. NPDC001262]|uniref:hypothetical protein n=1 Tax=Streptomyces sp. NPDC001262 TaxID=3364552 RepID=UPI003686D6EE
MEWQGEGGEAFRTWGADMANATLRLGEFSDGAGKWMGHAAGTPAHVQSAMPEVSTTSRTTPAAYRTANPGQAGAVAPPLTGAGQSGGLQGRGPSARNAVDIVTVPECRSRANHPSASLR